MQSKPVLLPLVSILCFVLPHAVLAQNEDQTPIDPVRGRALMQKASSGETLSNGEQAYLERVKQAVRQRSERTPKLGDVDVPRARRLQQRVQAGAKKTTTLLLNFFKTNEGPSQWFLKQGEKPVSTHPISLNLEETGIVTMRLRHVLKALILSLIGMPSIVLAEEKPNIVIILTDDQGYADVSYNPHSPPEVSTPNIDALAHSSIICSQGYTSGHVCSPTRAGLMTGRYQQRFGIYTAGEGGSGVPLDEVFIPQRLKPVL